MRIANPVQLALRQNYGFYLSLLFVLIAATVLRVTGLHWGIPTVGLPHVPLHTDEEWAMNVLRSVDFSTGSWSPLENYREGALIPYLWAWFGYLLKAVGFLSQVPSHTKPGDLDFERLFYACRLFNALFDVGSVFLVAWIVRKITQGNKFATIAAAAAFAITPFEVIYNHFLRPHTSSSFFALLAIYACLSLRNEKTISPRETRWIGILIGLAIAARYTAAFLLLIPPIFFVFETLCESKVSLKTRLSWVTKQIRGKPFWKPIGRIFGFTVLTFFVTEPCFLTHYGAVRDLVIYQVKFSPPGQFFGLGLFDFSRVWTYIQYIVPYGTLPSLWILFYFSVLYLLVVRKQKKATYCVLAFLVFYFILMSKGYLGAAIYIRPAILTFPLFAILSGIALADLMKRLHSQKILRIITLSAVGVIYSSTLLYTYAYVSAMAQEDSRISVYHRLASELRASPEKRPLKLGLTSGQICFAMNTVFSLLPSHDFQVIGADDFAAHPEIKVDYVIVGGYYDYAEYDQAKVQLKKLLDSGRFMAPEVYKTEISALGVKFDYPRNPPDLAYPFPAIYLLKPKS